MTPNTLPAAPRRSATPAAALPLLILLAAAPLCSAQAGTLAPGAAWKPAACGPEPTPAALNLSNADAYNASVPAVTDYRLALKAFLDCLVGEANADIQAVTKAATAAQQAARAANDRIQADIKSAEQKFK